MGQAVQSTAGRRQAGRQQSPYRWPGHWRRRWRQRGCHLWRQRWPERWPLPPPAACGRLQGGWMDRGPSTLPASRQCKSSVIAAAAGASLGHAAMCSGMVPARGLTHRVRLRTAGTEACEEHQAGEQHSLRHDGGWGVGGLWEEGWGGELVERDETVVRVWRVSGEQWLLRAGREEAAGRGGAGAAAGSCHDPPPQSSQGGNSASLATHG